MPRGRFLVLQTVTIAALLSAGAWFGVFRPFQERIIDLLFVRHSPMPHVVIVAIDDESIQSVGQWPWPRTVFGQLVSALQNATVIGIDVNFKEQSRLGTADDIALSNALAFSRVPVILTADLKPDGTLSAPQIPNQQKYYIGYPNLPVGSGGIVRSVTYLHDQAESFSRIAARLSGQTITEPPNDTMRIDFAGPSGTYPMVSVHDVLDRALPQKFFEQAIVLVGATAKDLHDYHITPFGTMAGVEVQANAIGTLLQQRWYSSHVATTIALIIVFSAWTLWITLRIQRLRTLIVTIAGTLILYAIAVFVSFDLHYILDLVYPCLAIFATAGTTIAYQYVTTSQEKKFIQKSFSRYLAPQVIHQLMHDPSKLKLGGTRETLTILFSDIRNFTSFSEEMSPEELTSFLNNYLSRMTTLILHHQGLVDKYIGDAIMAFWGAPLYDRRHAIHGVCAALDMVDALASFNSSGNLKRYPKIDIGIGINSGDATVGNMGSEIRFDYTAMGDNVNLASRLEGLTKTYGINILVSNATVVLLDERDKHTHRIMLRELDRVQVKGKKQAVTIFEVVSRARQKSIAPIADDFAIARDAYYEGRWEDAIISFDMVLAQLPDDIPSQVLKDRCSGFLHRPMDNWHGVFEMTHK